MTRLFFAGCLFAAHMAYAYEYKLQFAPPSGANGVTVAGYQFNTNTVIGNCSYYTSSGGRYSHPVWHYNSCSWDIFGNVLSMTAVSSAPVASAVLSTNGTEIIYASNGSSKTGRDTRGFGFVNTPSPHYSWQTTSGGYVVISDALLTVTVALVSDGDFPLDFYRASVSASVFGTLTPSSGSASVSSTTCPSSLSPGTPCSVTISYNPRTIVCTASPYGYGYTGIDLSVATNSGPSTDWTERFTITGIPICDD